MSKMELMVCGELVATSKITFDSGWLTIGCCCYCVRLKTFKLQMIQPIEIEMAHRQKRLCSETQCENVIVIENLNTLGIYFWAKCDREERF